MARRAPFRTRLGAPPEFLMAPGALLVKRIRELGDIGVVAFSLVALAAGRWIGLALFQVMVTVAAGKTIPERGGMGLVVKQDIAGNAMEHQSYRLFRRSGGKGGITDHTHNEQNDGHCIRRSQLFF